MKKTDFKTKNKTELINLFKEKKENIRNFHFGISGSKTRDVKEGKKLKKEIARILTALNSSQKI
ncbi:MAG: 50S ribosomal protein L29 [Patescibacteria group bacterium]